MLRPRTDLGAGEGGMGALESPSPPASPISPRSRCSCFPGSRTKGEAFALSHRNRDGEPGLDGQWWMGWWVESPRAGRLPCGRGTVCGCRHGPVSSPCPSLCSLAGLGRGEWISLCCRAAIISFLCRGEDGLCVRSGGGGYRLGCRASGQARAGSRCEQRRKGFMHT